MRKQVTKQMILITTCFVFALALSGVVAAEENTNEVISYNTTANSTGSDQILKTELTKTVSLYLIIYPIRHMSYGLTKMNS